MSGIKLGQGKRTIRNIKSNVIDPHCDAWRDEQGMVWPPGLCCRNIEELLQWVKAWFPVVASPGDGVGGVLLWPHQCTGIAESLPKGRTKISLVSIQKFENQQFMNTSVHPEQPKQTKANQSKPKHGGSTPSSPAVMSHSKVLYSFSFRHCQLTQIWVKLWDFKRKTVQKSLGLIKKMQN